MNIKVAGLTIRGLEESSFYQYVYGLGYQDGFRDYFIRVLAENPDAAEQATSQGLF
ncbi:MAG: hypothetical protein HOP19_02825 [Acidobacteria bacterium]|nr:hypothetical protein [Acidobacteriota bacterium]